MWCGSNTESESVSVYLESYTLLIRSSNITTASQNACKLSCTIRTPVVIKSIFQQAAEPFVLLESCPFVRYNEIKVLLHRTTTSSDYLKYIFNCRNKHPIFELQTTGEMYLEKYILTACGLF